MTAVNALKGTALYRWLHARGYVGWKELIPTADFEAAVGSALDQTFPGGELHTYVEFGVSRGTSMASMYHLFHERSNHFVFYGFDSFQGMPPGSEEEGWSPGAYRSTLPATKRYLADRGVDPRRVTLVPGWFDETLTGNTRAELGLDRADVFMFDCDTYSATAQALEFSEALIGDRALLIFDDWGWRADRGERGQKEAFEEFLGRNPGCRYSTCPPYIEQARIVLLERGA